MKRCVRYFYVIAVGCFLMAGAIFHADAQISSLEVIGTAENNFEPIENARVTLYKNGSKVQSVFSDSRGEFRFALDINSEYLIEVEKAGLLSKKIAFNTEVPSEVTGKWTMEFAMSLFPGCEGVNTSVLTEPVDRVKFSTNKADFISDEAYVNKIRGRIEQLLSDIEKCQADKYQEAMKKADNLASQKKYEEARASYEEALHIYPADKAAQRKIADLDKASGLDKKNEQVYNSAIAEADRLYAAKDYEAAKTKYTEAFRAMPQNSYPQSKINEINSLIQKQRQQEQANLDIEKNYNGLIAKANNAYAAKDYAAAKEFYRQAAEIKPEASLPRQKMTELEPLIEQQKKKDQEKAATDKAFAEAMAMGQTALQNNDLDAARQHFNRAMMMKPEESLPKQKIAEIDQKTRERQQAKNQAEKAAQQQKITKALDDGDAFLAQKNLDAAEEAYKTALQLDPNDAYAKQQLNKVKSMQASAEAQKQQTLEKAYRESIDQGDKLLAAASYQQAVEAYKQALLKKPDDIAAKNKLAQAEQRLAAEQQKQLSEQTKRKQYDDLLAKANNSFTDKQYEEAKQSYQSALNLYPDQSYPRTRIQEIERLLTEQQKEHQYNDLITKADEYFGNKSYELAKTTYQQAIGIKPADTYAKQRIAEIDRISQENARLASEQKARDTQYATAIQEADNLLAQAKYTEARLVYQRALGLKPTEAYPQQQIGRIDGIIAEQVKKENEKKSLDQQYSTLISKADGFLSAKDYNQAKTYYQQASALKSTEVYPKQKVAEIDGILREQERLAAEQKARDEQYKKTVLEADNLFTAAKLEEARAAYQRALAIKPAESYPSAQIVKIDALLAEAQRTANEQRAKEFQYSNAVSQADQYFSQDKLAEAKVAYQNALSIKPGESYPAGQIAKIDAQLALKEKDRQEKAAFEQRYNSLISAADQAYDKRDYPSAKSSYMQALNLKPGEKYPQERLNKIAEFERILAQQEANRKTVNNEATAKATASSAPPKLEELKFANDSEREKYLKALRNKYPAGVTLEVYKEKNLTTYRYIVIRGDDVREFRKMQYSWGGVDFTENGIPTTGQYFDTQVKARQGEFFQQFDY